MLELEETEPVPEEMELMNMEETDPIPEESNLMSEETDTISKQIDGGEADPAAEERETEEHNLEETQIPEVEEETEGEAEA